MSPKPLEWMPVVELMPPPAAVTASGQSQPAALDLLHYLHNDHGNSERIVAMYGEDLRWCPPFKKWLVWDGRRWAVDAADQSRRLAKEVMLDYLRQAMRATFEPGEKFAKASLDSKRISNALREAQDQLYVMPAELDQHPYLLNFLDCTVDLRTGEKSAHQRSHFITKMVHYAYRPGAPYPEFMRFLEKITGGGPDASEPDLERSVRLIGYLQRAFGYSLTGVTREKAVFLLHGPRDNGKTTLLTMFLKVLEEYSVLLLIDTLMVKVGGETNNTQADLCDLRGARFAMTSETEEGQHLASAKLKRITQGIGRIKAVRKYENPIEFDESHKLWIDANYLPVVKAHDEAIWRRLHAVPFTVTIPKDQQDRGLPDKLMAEAEGILAWAVTGAVRWYRDGLDRPAEIETTSAVWRADMNQVGRFVEECCVRVGQSRAHELFLAYQQWAAGIGERSVPEVAFSARIQEMKFDRDRDDRGSYYIGIGLRFRSGEK
jgi:putative DNA primase/helicase